MAIRVAVTLGLPDRLSDRSATAATLAAELDVAPIPLAILLNHLATLGIVEAGPDGFHTTEFGAHLRVDAGNGLANLMDIGTAGGRGELAFVELAHTIATGESGYIHRYGQDFWTDLTEQPRLRESFDRQMTHRFHEHIQQIVGGFDWSRFTGIVDVGGGHGSLLAAILIRYPALHGHLVDLEATAAGARRRFDDLGLGERARVTGGSFFDALPAGADAYLMFDILHNWDDEQASRILGRCVEAARPTSRILVIEGVGGLRAGSESDLSMLAIYGGRERRIDEFRALTTPHGLILEEVTALTPARCLLEFRFAGN
jgi:hypothetical protein